MTVLPPVLPSAAAPAALTLPAPLPTLHAFAPVPSAALASDAFKTPLALHYPWLTHTFAAFFLGSAIVFVILMALQTTKQEGLGGGSRVDAYRSRLGVEGQLARVTESVAWCLVISATLVSLSGI